MTPMVNLLLGGSTAVDASDNVLPPFAKLTYDWVKLLVMAP